MKALKLICAAAVLALSLSITTYADGTDPGILHMPGFTSPAGGNDSPSSPGDIGSPGVASPERVDLGSLPLLDTLWTMLSMF